MMTRALVVAGLACMLLAAAMVTADAQSGKPSVQQATITANKWVYNWKNKTFEFTGNVRVEVKGPDHAVMNSPKMTGKTKGGGNQIYEISAVGPVKFDITTAKDEEGVQRMIRAACAGGAVYRGGDKVVTLSGGAEAVMTTIPEDPSIQPGKMTASTLTINLDTFEIGGDDFKGEMQFMPKEEKKGP